MRYPITGVSIRLPESTTVYSCQSPDADRIITFLGDFIEHQLGHEVRFDRDYSERAGKPRMYERQIYRPDGNVVIRKAVAADGQTIEWPPDLVASYQANPAWRERFRWLPDGEWQEQPR